MLRLRGALFFGLPLVVGLGCSAAPSGERAYSEPGGAGGTGGSGGSTPDGGGTGGVAGDSGVPDASNPCEGVTCNTPPANQCANENQLRVYAANGTCDAGQCRYTDQLVDCPNGCLNDACVGDPCLGVTCNIPPANQCADASHLAVYEVPGSCTDGVCGYDTHNEFCDHGCANGACEGDPCIGVTCNTPPANYCSSAEELAVYESQGTCDEGTCAYEYTPQPCQFGCASGACNGDPCLGVTCATPPADFCTGDTLTEYPATGTCSDGSCSYASTDTVCPHGCDQGACLECSIDTDCTGGNWCDDGACKPCDENAHCGPSCDDCTSAGDVCNAGSTACVDCNVDGDCASGEWCNGNVCTACDTNDHCGPSCVACSSMEPNCDGYACRCTANSCGPHYLCAGGSCAFCDTNSTCGPNCEPCAAPTPYCNVEGTTSACVECTNDTQCASGFICDLSSHACVDPCAPPIVACANGSESRDRWSGARTIGRPQAATTSGYQISDHTCNAYDRFDESGGCWDANADHAYRIYLRQGESIDIFMDSSWDCNYDYNWWNMTLSIYDTAGDCQNVDEGERIFCLDQDDQHSTTYTAPHDGWYYLTVDGSSAFDDEGDYVFQVKLTCNNAGCEC